MRAIRSPMGSLTMVPLLPARLDEAGDQAGGPEVAQRGAAHLELAVIAPRTAGDLAAVADPGRRGVARHLRELKPGVEAFLQRQGLVVGDVLQQLTLGRVLLHEL